MKKTLLLGLLLAAGLTATAQTSGDDTSLVDGSNAPDFTAPDVITNDMITLYDYLDAGKSVVIDFSATWCAPCWAYHGSGALEDFYYAYGPDGSDEAMVIFVEGDIYNTTTANIFGEQGPIAPSQGDWTIGSPYPIVEDTEAMNLGAGANYDVDYFPTMYVICAETKTTLRADQLTATQLRNKMNTCQTLTGRPNHGRITQSTTVIRLCQSGETTNVVAKLKNYGNNQINTATVVLKQDGEVIATKNYTGTLNQFASAASVTFNNITLNAGVNYTIELLDINGVAQTNPELNTTPLQFSVGGQADNNMIRVDVHTDFYPAECAWEIRDSSNTVVASGGPYQIGDEDQYGGGGPDANTVKTEWVTLPGDSPECYKVVLKDVGDYQDGWGYQDGGVGGATDTGIEIYSNDQLVFQKLNVGAFGPSLSTSNAFRAMGVLGNETINATTFAMYPNPTTGLLNFTTQEPVDVTVLDITGKVVFTAKGIENGGSVNLSSLQSGMYVAKIKGSASERVEKIVIE